MKLPAPLAALRPFSSCRAPPGDEAGLPLQTAALPWRSIGDDIEILLITSRDMTRWMIPKGRPMIGKSLAEAAAIEAFEEGGVEGKINEETIGCFEHLKRRWLRHPARYRVFVYELAVERVLDTWPEHKDRQRRWVPAREAPNLVESAPLADVLRDFTQQVLGRL